MSQHDLSIANQGFPAFRSDLNDALQALGSLNSGTTAPSTTYANMLWYDTTNNIIKIRNEDNDAWISLFTLDQSTDAVSSITATTVNGTTVAAGTLTSSGNTTLGDASGDSVTINASTVSIPNGLTFDSNVLSIDATNNRVGILNTNPSMALDVREGSIVAGTSGMVLYGRQSASVPSASYGTGFFGLGVNYTDNATGGLTIYTRTSDSLTEKMRVTSAGNVGIGTSSPAHQLDVANGARANYLQIVNGGYAGSAATTPEIYSPSAATLAFGAGGGERMRIDSNGRLLINNTNNTIGGRTNYTFSVVNNGSDTVGISQSSNTSFGLWSFVTTTSGTRYHLGFGDGTSGGGGGGIGSISTNGTSTSFNTTSDYRLKENIAPMTGALNKVAQLKPVTYTWKSNGSDGQGFIAHELQAVIPDAVVGEKDGVKEDGTPQYQQVDTSFLVATLTAAIQELKAEVDSLKAQLNA